MHTLSLFAVPGPSAARRGRTKGGVGAAAPDADAHAQSQLYDHHDVPGALSTGSGKAQLPLVQPLALGFLRLMGESEMHSIRASPGQREDSTTRTRARARARARTRHDLALERGTHAQCITRAHARTHARTHEAFGIRALLWP